MWAKNSFGSTQVFTANLNIDFLKKLPVNTNVVIEAEITHIEGRKLFGVAKIMDATSGVSYAKCKVIFVVSKL